MTKKSRADLGLIIIGIVEGQTVASVINRAILLCKAEAYRIYEFRLAGDDACEELDGLRLSGCAHGSVNVL
jgi:hypothetical protein